MPFPVKKRRLRKKLDDEPLETKKMWEEMLKKKLYYYMNVTAWLSLFLRERRKKGVGLQLRKSSAIKTFEPLDRNFSHVMLNVLCTCTELHYG